VLAVGLAAAGCSGGGKGEASGSAKQTPSTTTPVTKPASNTTTPAAARTQTLASVVVPAPAGFVVAHEASARNGPMTATDLNQMLNSSTVASESHYVDGYHADYDNLANQDTIEVFVADFASNQDAQSFQGSFVPSDTAKSINDPAIPGADDFNSTTANPDGSFDHGVIAAKGKRVMMIDYLTGAPTAVPAVAALAQQQYARI
jgi:hypothetical protein